MAPIRKLSDQTFRLRTPHVIILGEEPLGAMFGRVFQFGRSDQSELSFEPEMNTEPEKKISQRTLKETILITFGKEGCRRMIHPRNGTGRKIIA